MRATIGVAGALLSLFLGGASTAQSNDLTVEENPLIAGGVVRSLDLDQLSEAIATAGFLPTISHSATGLPYIVAEKANGARLFATLGACDLPQAGKGCQLIEYLVLMNLPASSPALVNNFNIERRTVSAGFLEGSLTGLTYRQVLRGGVLAENVGFTFGLFLEDANTIQEMVIEQSGPGPFEVSVPPDERFPRLASAVAATGWDVSRLVARFGPLSPERASPQVPFPSITGFGLAVQED